MPCMHGFYRTTWAHSQLCSANFEFCSMKANLHDFPTRVVTFYVTKLSCNWHVRVGTFPHQLMSCMFETWPCHGSYGLVAIQIIYIKYKPFKPGKRASGKGNAPDEQIIELGDLPVQTPKQLGTLISHRAVDWLKTTRPRGWNETGGPAIGPLFN